MSEKYRRIKDYVIERILFCLLQFWLRNDSSRLVRSATNYSN